MKTKIEMISNWIKDHKHEIILVGATAIIVGGSTWLVYNGKVKSLDRIISAQVDMIWEQADRIVELEDLCLVKDDYVKELASELLREGQSIGGQLMAERKAFLNAA